MVDEEDVANQWELLVEPPFLNLIVLSNKLCFAVNHVDELQILVTLREGKVRHEST